MLIPFLIDGCEMVTNGNGPPNGDHTDPGGSRASTAALTRAYIETHPSVRDALRMGIVNYSALSRLIVEATDISSEEAIIAALRRHEDPAPWLRAGFDDVLRQPIEDEKITLSRAATSLTSRPISATA